MRNADGRRVVPLLSERLKGWITKTPSWRKRSDRTSPRMGYRLKPGRGARPYCKAHGVRTARVRRRIRLVDESGVVGRSLKAKFWVCRQCEASHG